jgi:hypothetical protein
VNGQNPLLDVRFRPYAGKKFLLREQFSRLPHERDEYVIRFWRQPHRLRAVQEFALCNVQSELAETKNFPAGHDVFGKS